MSETPFIIAIDTEGDDLWAKPRQITTRNARWLEIGNVLGNGWLADTQLGCRRRKRPAPDKRRKGSQPRLETGPPGLMHEHERAMQVREANTCPEREKGPLPASLQGPGH